MAAAARLLEAGLRLEVRGDTLLVKPRSALTDDMRAFIREHKPELMAELRRTEPTYTRCLNCVRYTAPPPDTAFWCPLVRAHPTVALWAICTAYEAKSGATSGPTVLPDRRSPP